MIAAVAVAPAQATPALTMDVATGDVLYQQDATQPWYPASTTKLLTVYVALSAVRDGKIAMNTPLVVSARADRMPPSKMGFPVGTQVTLDNALKMLLVRSANDLAIVIAEGIAGSVEAFADDMNQAAAEIGLHESHFVNPNGLPDPAHYSSARDMALIARALYAQFPQYAPLFDIGALQLGGEIIPNHNNLLGRYPGADGMKTGFTCAAGFNVVATAFRDGRRLLVVVFGAPSVPARTQKVAALFDRGFAGIDKPIGSIVALPPSASSTPTDMHNQVCRNRAGLIAQFNNEVQQLDAPLTAPVGPGLGLASLNPARSFLFNTQNAAPMVPTALTITTMPMPAYDPVPVHIGADIGYSGVVAEARAPHSAIGSGTPPVSVEAYAATPPGPPQAGIGGTPLAIDANALPLHGRRARLAARAHRGHATMNAAAEAPKTKVIAGAEEDDGGKGADASKARPKPAPAKVVAAKPARAKVALAKPVAGKAAPAKASVAKATVAKSVAAKSVPAKANPVKTATKTPAKVAMKSASKKPVVATKTAAKPVKTAAKKSAAAAE